MHHLGVLVAPGPALERETLQGRPLLDLAHDALTLALTDTDNDVVVLARDHVVSSLPRLLRSTDVLVLHDAQCPLVSPAGIVVALESAYREPDTGFVSVRPVTDTIKSVDHDGTITGTLDRDRLVALASPVVLGPDALQLLPDPLVADPQVSRTGDDLADVVTWVRRWLPVRWLDAEPRGRRVDDPAALSVLAALSGVGSTSD